MKILQMLAPQTPERRAKAASTPLRFLAGEWARHAGIMAFVLAVFDLFEATRLSGTPAFKLYFIVAWSALMAGWTLWIARRVARTPAPRS